MPLIISTGYWIIPARIADEESTLHNVEMPSENAREPDRCMTEHTQGGHSIAFLTLHTTLIVHNYTMYPSVTFDALAKTGRRLEALRISSSCNRGHGQRSLSLVAGIWRSMGNDGGTVSNARKIVVKRKKVRRDMAADEKRELKWGTCAISGEKLSLPLVIDQLGNLINREAAMRFFLKQLSNPSFSHLRKFKRDVVELQA